MTEMLRPEVRCPNCGRAPRLRIPEEERDAAGRQPPSALKSTVQCRCGAVYPIRAGAYYGAR